MIAIAAGSAGSFALVRRDVANILAGVAIAISLVPVLAVVGITLGTGRLDLALGAFILFLTNAAAIIVAGVVVFTAAGYERDAAPRRGARDAAPGCVVASSSSCWSSHSPSRRCARYRYLQWTSATEAAARQWVAGHAAGG